MRLRFHVWRRVGFAVALLGVIGSSIIGACSSDDSPTSSERPLTTREAAQLAEVLVKNYRTGGVEFMVATLDRPGGSTIRMEGRLDWVDHVGEASVYADRGRIPVVVGWRHDVVLERWPEADEVLLGMGAPATPVIARPPNLQRRLDQIISVLVGLAGERPENAQLILQTEGSAYLREDEWRGRSVAVMRFGTRNVYWLDSSTGEMVRFEARSAEGDLPIVVDVMGSVSETIELPDPSTWVSVDSIEDFYSGLSPAI